VPSYFKQTGGERHEGLGARRRGAADPRGNELALVGVVERRPWCGVAHEIDVDLPVRLVALLPEQARSRVEAAIERRVVEQSEVTAAASA
jgi:hypothetical protein